MTIDFDYTMAGIKLLVEFDTDTRGISFYYDDPASEYMPLTPEDDLRVRASEDWIKLLSQIRWREENAAEDAEQRRIENFYGH